MTNLQKKLEDMDPKNNKPMITFVQFKNMWQFWNNLYYGEGESLEEAVDMAHDEFKKLKGL